MNNKTKIVFILFITTLAVPLGSATLGLAGADVNVNTNMPIISIEKNPFAIGMVASILITLIVLYLYYKHTTETIKRKRKRK